MGAFVLFCFVVLVGYQRHSHRYYTSFGKEGFHHII
jgi:hypothetical protein